MTKEDAKDFLPLLQALAEGKTLQVFCNGEWQTATSLSFDHDVSEYRIKPGKVYVPFDTVEELLSAWYQTHSHCDDLSMPLIWLKHKGYNKVSLLTDFLFEKNKVAIRPYTLTLLELFGTYTFLDGTPIGKLVEA